MTSLYYNIGGGGPWLVDDDAIVCDGRLVSAALAGGPTVDGLELSRTHRGDHGGLAQGHDEHLAHAGDTHLTQGSDR